MSRPVVIAALGALWSLPALAWSENLPDIGTPIGTVSSYFSGLHQRLEPVAVQPGDRSTYYTVMPNGSPVLTFCQGALSGYAETITTDIRTFLQRSEEQSLRVSPWMPDFVVENLGGRRREETRVAWQLPDGALRTLAWSAPARSDGGGMVVETVTSTCPPTPASGADRVATATPAAPDEPATTGAAPTAQVTAEPQAPLPAETALAADPVPSPPAAPEIAAAPAPADPEQQLAAAGSGRAEAPAAGRSLPDVTLPAAPEPLPMAAAQPAPESAPLPQNPPAPDVASTPEPPAAPAEIAATAPSAIPAEPVPPAASADAAAAPASEPSPPPQIALAEPPPAPAPVIVVPANPAPAPVTPSSPLDTSAPDVIVQLPPEAPVSVADVAPAAAEPQHSPAPARGDTIAALEPAGEDAQAGFPKLVDMPLPPPRPPEAVFLRGRVDHRQPEKPQRQVPPPADSVQAAPQPGAAPVVLPEQAGSPASDSLSDEAARAAGDTLPLEGADTHAAGPAETGSLPSQPAPDQDSRSRRRGPLTQDQCAAKFASYDRATGTYRTLSGTVRACP